MIKTDIEYFQKLQFRYSTKIELKRSNNEYEQNISKKVKTKILKSNHHRKENISIRQNSAEAKQMPIQKQKKN